MQTISTKKIIKFLCATITAATLIACGSGGDTDTTTPASTTPAATASDAPANSETTTPSTTSNTTAAAPTTTTPATPVAATEVFTFTSVTTPSLTLNAGGTANATIKSNERFNIVSSTGYVGNTNDQRYSGACSMLNPTIGSGYSVIYVGTCTRTITFSRGAGSAATVFVVTVQ